jgi:hypothetical protein
VGERDGDAAVGDIRVKASGVAPARMTFGENGDCESSNGLTSFRYFTNQLRPWVVIGRWL